MAAKFFYAKVTQTSPRLLIATFADPAHPFPAEAISSYTPEIGDQVRVQDRITRGPIVQGSV